MGHVKGCGGPHLTREPLFTHPGLNASINKERVPSLNPKQSEISPLNGEVVYNLRKMLVSTQRREFENDNQTHILVRN